MDKLRHFVMMTMLPVYFMSAGLRTNWEMDGVMVFAAAAILLFASIAGKLAGTYAASKILKWEKGEAWIIGWLLQTKALIMIVFSIVLLDKQIITSHVYGSASDGSGKYNAYSTYRDTEITAVQYLISQSK